MVAIASGGRTQIRRWEASLRQASIEYIVAKPLVAPVSAPDFRAEVWVDQRDAEKARTVLRHSCMKDELTMW
jgi:hypothetical protein